MMREVLSGNGQYWSNFRPVPTASFVCFYYYYYLFILTAIVLTPGGSITVHTNCTQNTENKTYIIKRTKKIGKCEPSPVFASYTLAFALQLRKRHGKTSDGVVKKCPDIPVAVAHYTFTHKQYTEQHNETEYTERNIHKYTERNIHNNKNT
jgi:hypothetical protein